MIIVPHSTDVWAEMSPSLSIMTVPIDGPLAEVANGVVHVSYGEIFRVYV